VTVGVKVGPVECDDQAGGVGHLRQHGGIGAFFLGGIVRRPIVKDWVQAQSRRDTAGESATTEVVGNPARVRGRKVPGVVESVASLGGFACSSGRIWGDG